MWLRSRRTCYLFINIVDVSIFLLHSLKTSFLLLQFFLVSLLFFDKSAANKTWVNASKTVSNETFSRRQFGCGVGSLVDRSFWLQQVRSWVARPVEGTTLGLVGTGRWGRWQWETGGVGGQRSLLRQMLAAILCDEIWLLGDRRGRNGAASVPARAQPLPATFLARHMCCGQWQRGTRKIIGFIRFVMSAAIERQKQW